MKLIIENPGSLTTVQDLGRWGSQALGMPVSGAMDCGALIRGNILLNNPDNSAALEITMTGPAVKFSGEGAIAITGADLQPELNGKKIENWKVFEIKTGDILTFKGISNPPRGLRSYLCVSGGIDVPVIMGSRSTYIKAKTGGFKGRKLMKGDELQTGPESNYKAGKICPENLRPDYSNAPLRTISGPQDDYIKPEGIKTFFETEYKLSPSSDRMGSRFESEIKIEHVKGADIISDAIPLGAVQIPGNGLPIVMMADRQTTGGYVKIGVVHSLDIARLSQFLPGSPVRFTKITQEEGIELSKLEAEKIKLLRNEVSKSENITGAMNITVNGKKYYVTWGKIE